MTTPTRKARRKATTELGRSIMQRERQRLAREQALLGETLAEEARRAQTMAQHHAKQIKPEAVAVSRGLIRRVAAVLASENVNLPIETSMTLDRMSAWTDFNKIHVTYRTHDDIRLLAATLRGLMYHEGGHVRFTMPWDQMLTRVQHERRVAGEAEIELPFDSKSTLQRAWNALEDQRMETAVVSDSPRKAAYFTPVILTELCSTLDDAAANYPLLIWRKYLPRKVRVGARKLFVLRHGAEGEQIAQALEAVVQRYVLATDAVTMVHCVIEMETLLRVIRPLAYNLNEAGHGKQYRKAGPLEGWEDALTIPVDPSMLGEDFGQAEDAEDEDEDGELDLTDPAVAAHLVEVFGHLMIDPWNLIKVRYVVPSVEGAETDGDQQQGESSGGVGDLLGDQDMDDNFDDRVPGEDRADNETSKDDTSDETSTGGSAGSHTDDGSDQADDSKGGKDGKGTEGGADTDEDLTQDDLNEALKDAEDERLSDSALSGDVDSYHDALENKVSDLQPYIGGVSDNSVAQVEAAMLAAEIEQAFQAATIDRAPAWVEGQRRGVVNVSRYATRQPGEQDFYKAWVDDDQPGFDISVSVLLDYSGSMSGSTTELAQCGYASKLACDRLGIPCTVVLWDTHARTLYDAQEQALDLPIIGTAGGTDPEHALADLENQRFDRAKHIVLIMTDGSWDQAWEAYGRNAHATRNLAAYKTEGRTFIGFGYGSEHLAHNLISKGCDEAYGITNLMEIPRQLENVLISLA